MAATTTKTTTSSFGRTLGSAAYLFSGINSYTSGMESASLLTEQGELSRDDYYRQAALTLDQGYRTRAKQTMEYISGGVEIAGTPQLVLKETLSKANAQSESYKTTGDNVYNLAKQKAKQAKNEGMSSLVSSVLLAGALLA
jgi:hypothetical protein